mmetsp:Transcript_66331/g.197359  ORF Transcript_66331/g.197359 Transcript_66331/m.197359 type:complete len:113 (+) Transcript_66331:113-451(+)
MDSFEVGGFCEDDEWKKVHIRLHPRNVRKAWTIVQGLPEQVCLPKSGRQMDVDVDKILRALKKTFQTNGMLIKDDEHGTIILLQGAIRKEVAEFLIDATALIAKDQVMIHGS